MQVNKIPSGAGGGTDIKSILNLTSGIAADKNTRVTLESNAKLGFALSKITEQKITTWNNSQPQIILIKKTSTNKYILIAKDTNTTSSLRYAVYDSSWTELKTWTAVPDFFGNIHQGVRTIRALDINGTDRFILACEPSTSATMLHLFNFNDGANTITRTHSEDVDPSSGFNSNNLVDCCIDTSRDKLICISGDGYNTGLISVFTFSGYASGSLTQDGTRQDYNLDRPNQYNFHQCAYDVDSDAVYFVTSKDNVEANQIETFKFAWDGTQYIQSGSSNQITATTIDAQTSHVICNKKAFCVNNKFVFVFKSTSQRPYVCSLDIAGGTMATSVVLEPYASGRDDNHRSEIINRGNDIYTLDSVTDKIYKSDVANLATFITDDNSAASPVAFTASNQEKVALVDVFGTNNIAIVYSDESVSNDDVGIVIYSGVEAFFSEGAELGVLKDNATVDNLVDVILDSGLQGQLVDQDNTNNAIGQAFIDGAIPISATQTLKPIGLNSQKSYKLGVNAEATISTSSLTTIASAGGKGIFNGLFVYNQSTTVAELDQIELTIDGVVYDFPNLNHKIAISSGSAPDGIPYRWNMPYKKGFTIKAQATTASLYGIANWIEEV